MLSTQTVADLRRHILTWSVVAISIGMASIVQETPGLSGGHARIVVFHAFDVVLVAAVALLAPASLRSLARHRREPVVLAVIAFALAMTVSFVLHPSLKSGFVVFRVFAGTVLVGRFLELNRDEARRAVAVPMMIVAGLQGLLAFAQLQLDSALGTGGFGGGDPDIVNGVMRAPGVLGHPYVLAAYGLFAVSLAVAYKPEAPTWRWHLGTAGAVLPVALSFGRSVILGFAVLLVALAVAAYRSAHWRPTLVALTAGFLIPAALFAGSWSARIEQTSTGDQIGVPTNVRFQLAEDAISLIEQEWLLGLGPGRYAIELERRLDVDSSNAYPVHDVPLYLLAELGVVLGGAVLLLLARATVSIFRHGMAGVALVTAPLGLILFDVLHLVDPIGILLLLLTLGAGAQLTVVRERTPVGV